MTSMASDMSDLVANRRRRLLVMFARVEMAVNRLVASHRLVRPGLPGTFASGQGFRTSRNTQQRQPIPPGARTIQPYRDPQRDRNRKQAVPSLEPDHGPGPG